MAGKSSCKAVMQPHHHEIINANVRLVDYWFKRWGHKLQRYTTGDELRAEAYYWLCRCAIKWESPRGISFSTYCLRSMLLGIMTWASRKGTRRKDMYTKRSQRWKERLEREGIPQFVTVLSFSELRQYTGRDGMQSQMSESWATPDIPPHNAQTEREDLIERLLKAATDREREIIRLYYSLDGYGRRTLEEVAQHFGVSRERIRQVVGNAFRRIRKYASSLGHTSENVFRCN